MYKKKFEKNFWGSHKPMKKVCDENERRKTDLEQLQVIDSSNNEGTNSLVNGRIRRERIVSRA